MLYLLITLVTLIWGLNGIFDRKALLTGHPIEVYFLTTLTMMGMVVIFLAAGKWSGVPFYFHQKTVFYAILNGILIPASYILYLYALSRGSITTVITITATYPLVTFILAAVFLHEPINLDRIIGIAMVMNGLYFLIK